MNRKSDVWPKKSSPTLPSLYIPKKGYMHSNKATYEKGYTPRKTKATFQLKAKPRSYILKRKGYTFYTKKGFIHYMPQKRLYSKKGYTQKKLPQKWTSPNKANTPNRGYTHSNTFHVID